MIGRSESMTTRSDYLKPMMLILVLAVLLPGCRPGKMPANIDLKAKQMVPPAGKALVYVYTTGLEAKVYCSGKYIGRLGKDRYLYTVVSPGFYDFAVDPDDNEQFRIEIKGDETYYLELQSEAGFAAPSFEFFRVKDETARAKMKTCGLSKDLGDMLD
jgi:hypothetical protein